MRFQGEVVRPGDDGYDEPRAVWNGLIDRRPAMIARERYPGGGIIHAMTVEPAPASRGYTASKDQLKKRLRRVEGQVRGIEKMVEEDRYCIDVLTQISAIQAALDKVALGLLDQHAHHCMAHGHGHGTPDEQTDELMSAVARLMRRG